MQCESVENRFEEHYDASLAEVSQHLEACPECRREWDDFVDLMARLQTLKAGAPSPELDRRVLQELETRGIFNERPSVLEVGLEWLNRLLPKVALAACLLLLLWMADLAQTRPPEELRALRPDRARLWTNLPDAVPPPAFPGPPPSQQRPHLVDNDSNPAVQP